MDSELFCRYKSLRWKKKTTISPLDGSIGKTPAKKNRRSRRKLSGYQLLPFCMLARRCLMSIVSVKIAENGGPRAAAVLHVPNDVPAAKAQKRH